MKIRVKAFLIHFSLSALIISGILSLVLFIWYPFPYLEMEGGYEIIALLIGVDLILGPLLTFIVYNPEKKELKFDLSIIVAIQLLALIYGTHTLYTVRPQYIAFAIDQFKLIPASEINADTLKIDSLHTGPFSKPRFVYVIKADTPQLKQKIMFEAIQGGKDIEYYPELYRPYQDNIDVISNNNYAISLARIIEKYPSADSDIKEIEAAHNLTREQLTFYPVTGALKSYIMVLNKKDASMIDIIRLSSWEI